MTIVLSITMALIAIMLIYVAHELKDIRENADKANFESDQNHRAIVQIVSTSNQNTKTFEGRFAQADKQIEDIIAMLQEITVDIHRLDGNIADVAKSEHEIRSYYVNFREPKFDNAGVEWSEEYVTHDDEPDALKG